MASDPIPPSSAEEIAAIEQLAKARQAIEEQLAKVVVGQKRVVEELLMALFCRGHCILEGVPGLAKTLMINTLAHTLSLSFSRIQFTPDLMPSDIIGTEVIEEDKTTGSRQLRFMKGPVFANCILADEINRTPPKTQAALLEAMQEHQVSVGGFQHRLPQPFFVLATQNPIEQEGTYPLPEAQLDRFMFKIIVDYPSEEEEFQIVKTTTSVMNVEQEYTLSARDILSLQNIVRRVPCADHILRYAMRFARSSRPKSSEAPTFIKDYVSWGAGPRASQFIILAAKAKAALAGRYYVSTDDIRSVTHPVLRHRILTNFNAEAEGINSDQIIEWLIRDIPRGQESAVEASLDKRIFAAPE
ncbi:MAG: hypothetical protein HJJLKODD_01780 [Phycisphaerae bacterium]|nr:hypothetical protein [Phycisphaerae bacterium]